MTLFDRNLHLALLLLAGCLPNSVKLDNDLDSDSASDDTTASTSASTSAGTTSDEPTTGEPVAEGVLEWTRKFDDISGFDMAIAGDGTIVVLGLSGYSYNGGDGGEYANTWLGKFDPAGALLWSVEEPLGEDFYVHPSTVAIGPGGVIHELDVDHGVLAGGKNQVRRFSPDGDLLGLSTLPARPVSIAATADGVIVGGYQSTGDNSAVAWATALDGAGEPTWERSFGDPGMRFSQVAAIAVDGDEVILGGSIGTEPISTRAHAWLLRAKLQDGATIWEREVSDAVATDVIDDLGLTADGTIVAHGRVGDAVVMAFSPAGEPLWMDPAIAPRGASVAVGKDGSYALTGGLYLDPDDPKACFAGDGTCPVAMQIIRHAPDRSPRWAATRDECRIGITAAVTPDDAILVLAGCSETGIGDAATGLMLFAP